MPKVVYRETVHTFQVDVNRHVNNAVYVQWLEIGRTRLLDAVGLPAEALLARGILPVVVETWIQYRRPLVFPDTVRIETWVAEVARASAWIEFRFHSSRDGVLAALARQRGAFVEAATNRPHRLTDDERRAFETALVPDEESKDRAPAP